MKTEGFSMVEMLVVLVIISILSSIATVNLVSAKKRADEASLKAMVHNLSTDLFYYLPNFDVKHRWKRRYNPKYLNHQLEKIWEKGRYDNVFGHKNPLSRSKAVLNWRRIPRRLRRPAIFITPRRRFSYERIRPRFTRKRLEGSVIVWMHNRVAKVEIFYVNVDGYKSAIKITAD